MLRESGSVWPDQRQGRAEGDLSLQDCDLLLTITSLWHKQFDNNICVATLMNMEISSERKGEEI